MKIFQVGSTAKMVRITTDNDRLIIQVPLNRIVYSISNTFVNFIITTNNRVITESFGNIKRENGTGFSSVQELSLYLTQISSETVGGGSGGGVSRQELEDRVRQSENSLNNNINQVNTSLSAEISTVNNNLSNEITSTNNNLVTKVDIAKAETPVLTLSDLPTPVSGIIDLLPNVTYRFQGLVNIGENQIRLSTSNTLLGFDLSDDGIIFSGSTHPLIVNNNTVSVDTITIRLTNNNAKFFQINNNSSSSVIFKKCIFSGAGSLGNVNGSNVFGLDNCVVSPLVVGGIQISGVVNDVIINNNIFLNNSASKQIFLDNLTSEAILITDNVFKTNSIGIDVNNVTLDAERMGIITSNGFNGSGQFIRGIYDDNTDWILEANSNILSTSAGYSPNNYLVIKDDFITGGTEPGEIGVHGWTFSNGSMSTAVPATIGHPGVVQRSGSTTTGQVCSFYLGRTNNAPTIAKADFVSLIWIVQLLGDVSSYDFSCGLANDWGALTSANAVRFVKLQANPNWQISTRAANIATVIDTGIAVNNSYFKLEIIKVSDSLFRFRINETLYVGEINTNIPTNSTLLDFGNNIVPRINQTRSFNIDYFSAIIKTNNR